MLISFSSNTLYVQIIRFSQVIVIKITMASICIKLYEFKFVSKWWNDIMVCRMELLIWWYGSIIWICQYGLMVKWCNSFCIIFQVVEWRFNVLVKLSLMVIWWNGIARIWWNGEVKKIDGKINCIVIFNCFLGYKIGCSLLEFHPTCQWW